MAVADHDIPNDVVETSISKTDDTVKVNSDGMLPSQELEENDDISRYGLTVTSETVEETTSDEGWQEANSKGRSGNTSNGRKFGKRRPALTKLNVQTELSNSRESRYGREINSLSQNVIPKSAIRIELSPQKQSRVRSLSSTGEVSVKQQVKASLSKVSSSPTTHNAMASKSLSYKEVALAPPGTVLKPLLDKAEDITVEKTEAETSSILNETSKHEESKSDSVVEAITKSETEGTHANENHSESTTGQELEEEKSKGKNGSKLSAAAEPFNPGPIPISHPLSSVAVTSVYDVRASQEMLAEPVVPPVAARVPCGPRSPFYYRTNYSFHMRQNFHKFPNPTLERNGSGPQGIMNPNAPEFVPRRAWQTDPVIANAGVPADSDTSLEISRPEAENVDEKSHTKTRDGTSKKTISETEKLELARQILLSFIVKSVQHNMDSSGESVISGKKKFEHSDAIENDSAIIKIQYGNEGKKRNDMVSQPSDSEAQKVVDVNKKNGDGEGFIVVTKRRKNKQQLTNGVDGLYNQQSICASVR